MNKKNNILSFHYVAWIIIILSGLSFFSCENDIEKIYNITKDTLLPDLSAYDMEMKYTDSAKLKAKITTPELHQYELPEDPYMEFPQGGKVKFYGPTGKIKSTISAKYAIYHPDKSLWEARNNVVCVNDKGEVLNTEQLFWEQEKEKIYSEKFSKIETEDGVFYGRNGFISNQEMTNWKLIGSKGTVKVEE